MLLFYRWRGTRGEGRGTSVARGSRARDEGQTSQYPLAKFHSKGTFRAASAPWRGLSRRGNGTASGQKYPMHTTEGASLLPFWQGSWWTACAGLEWFGSSSWFCVRSLHGARCCRSRSAVWQRSIHPRPTGAQRQLGSSTQWSPTTEEECSKGTTKSPAQKVKPSSDTASPAALAA